MTYRSSSAASRGSVPSAPTGPLRALQLIETVGNVEPFDIVPVVLVWGTAMSPANRDAAKVRWAVRTGYTILTRTVPPSFAPYNCVIRVRERGTEDTRRDYLAHLVFDEDHEVAG